MHPGPLTLLLPVLIFIQDQANPSSFPVEIRIFNNTLTGRSDSHTFQTDLAPEVFLGVAKLDASGSDAVLSPDRAIRTASDFMESLVKSKQFPKGYSIDDVRLTPFNVDTGDWYWEVSFQIFQTGKEIERISLAVL